MGGAGFFGGGRLVIGADAGGGIRLESIAHEAYLDCALPINCHQTISQPVIVAMMTEALHTPLLQDRYAIDPRLYIQDPLHRRIQQLLVEHAYTSVAEFVAYARANPGRMNYASVGNGSSSHLNMELLKADAGFDAVHIPFNGSPPAVTATVQGETQMLFAVMQPLQAQIIQPAAAQLCQNSAVRGRGLDLLGEIKFSGHGTILYDT